jgi:hypothetical protein
MRKCNLVKIVFVLIFLAYGIMAQSTNVDFPTPITKDEVKGKIPARDIGDSRLTSHYYVFDGRQGDIFINIEASNLDGDIDVFLAENLKPLTKINLYADSGLTQTGRELYLRKPERLILRIQGRTPNDDTATYSIKFTGSFQAVAAKTVAEEPKLPKVESESEGEVKVNSVGTIIETKPKPALSPKSAVAKNSTGKIPEKSKSLPESVSTVKPKPTKTTPKTADTKIAESKKESEKKVESPVAEDLSKSEETDKVENKEVQTPKPRTTRTKTTTKKTLASARSKKSETVQPNSNPAEELAKALENVRLVVEFKDATRIERPMNDVVRFGVDKGILTIINKDGSIGKYSILEISKISVQ